MQLGRHIPARRVSTLTQITYRFKRFTFNRNSPMPLLACFDGTKTRRQNGYWFNRGTYRLPGADRSRRGLSNFARRFPPGCSYSVQDARKGKLRYAVRDASPGRDSVLSRSTREGQSDKGYCRKPDSRIFHMGIVELGRSEQGGTH